jgi:hypothetical protein
MTSISWPLTGSTRVLLLVWCAASGLLGGEARAFAEHLPVVQVPLVETAPTIDGRLSDDAWKGSSKAMGFRFQNGREQVPNEQTECYLLTTKDALYVGIRCHESLIDRGLHALKKDNGKVTVKAKGVQQNSGETRTTEAQPRDSQIWEDDNVEIFLKPGEDADGPFHYFAINAFGTITDSFKGDLHWNASGYKAVSVIDVPGKEWTVEMVIPFSDLGLAQEAGVLAGGWRMNALRTRPGPSGSDSEATAWAPTYCRGSFVPEAFGYIFLEGFGGKAPYEKPLSSAMSYPEDPPYCLAYRDAGTAEAVEDGAGIEAGFGLRERFAKEGGYDRVTLDRSTAKVVDVNMRSVVALPFSGAGIRQVSGIRVEVDAQGHFTAPEQVCTLAFKRDADCAVVRVWEDKDNRIFVSDGTGDDANPGTEAKPLKSLLAGVKAASQNPKADLYVSGGDYHEAGEVNPRHQTSMYGGFDAQGWLRDPIIHEPVLLPHGFRENWIDDMAERFKDLRRARHLYNETRIHPRVQGKELVGALIVGGRRGEGIEGTPDTFVDGLSVFGCPDKGVYQPEFFAVTGRRTTRNCILVMFWSNAHAFMPSPGGAQGENNIIWGGIVGGDGHARPQMGYGGQHYRRNLFVGATGGDYTRMFLCWYNGGLVEGNQIHGGNSFGWSTLSQVGQGALNPANCPVDHVFKNNLVRTDFLTRGGEGTGFVAEGNHFHLLKGGFESLVMTRTLKIMDNRFVYASPATEASIFPTGDRMTRVLGGEWKGKVYVPPTGSGTGEPMISGNSFLKVQRMERRPPELVNRAGLSYLVARQGEDPILRPRSPATELVATASGSGEARLTWKPSADPDVVGYRIRFGSKPNSWANHEVTGKDPAAIVRGLAPGRWYFTVVPFKKGFVECWTLSNEVELDVR